MSWLSSLGSAFTSYAKNQSLGDWAKMAQSAGSLYSGYHQAQAAQDQNKMLADHYAWQRSQAADDLKRRNQAQSNLDQAASAAFGSLGSYSGGY